MPYFTKQEHELATQFDKWLYFLKNLATLEDVPAILREDRFKQGFQIAEIANLNREEQRSYERSLMVYRDLKNVIDTAREEGIEQGLEQGRLEGIATLKKIREQMIAQGLDEVTITKLLGEGDTG
jgi:predicted transposase/invertase (TIGR01784 family)